MEATTATECVPGCGYAYELVPDGTIVSDAECAAVLKASRHACLDARGLAWHGVSLLLHAVVLGTAAVFAVPLAATDVTVPDPDQRAFIAAMLSAQAERELDATPTTEGQASPGHAGEGEHAVGQTASGSGRDHGHSGPSVGSGPSTRAEALNDAATFGMIGVLEQTGMTSSSPWGLPIGTSGASGMWADGLGEFAGSGGLDLTGVGESGGPGGGISGGGIRTAGRDPGFGGRRPRGLPGHETAPPGRMRAGSPVVGGHLPSDLVQRTVRQSFGRFRGCYEAGLRSNPTLAGRVSVRFIIGRDGGVVSSSNGGSDLSDPVVVGCVVGAFRGLSFPAPPDGIVTVTYPIVFSPQ